MPAGKRRGRILATAALLIMAGLFVSILFTYRKAAVMLSELLTDRIGVPVTVSLVEAGLFTGVTLYNVRVDNPPGFASPHIIVIPALTIQPDYPRLLDGEVAIKRVGMTAPVVYLEKDSGGRWDAVALLEAYRAKNPSTGKPAPKFSVGEVFLSSGNVRIDGMAEPVKIVQFMLGGLTNTTAKPAEFEFGAGYGDGVYVSGDGALSAFSGRPGATGRLAVRVDGLDEYITPPAHVSLKDAASDTILNFKLKDGVLYAKISGSVYGVKADALKGQLLSAGLTADTIYDMEADRVVISSARLTMPGMPAVGISGNIIGVKKGAVGNIVIDIAGFDLNTLKMYMPEGMSAGGRALPARLRVEGPLRPFTASVSGEAGLENASLGYAGGRVEGVDGTVDVKYTGARGATAKLRLGGMDVSYKTYRVAGVGIAADAVWPPGGKARLDAAVNLPAGKIALKGVYGKGAGSFELDSDSVELARIGTGNLQASGDLAINVRGNYGTNPKSVDAEYRLDAKDIAYGEKKIKASRIKTAGKAVYSGGSPSAGGRLDAEGVLFSGRDASAGFAYRWDGRLDVKDIAYADQDVSAGADRAGAGFADGRLDMALSGGRASYKDGLVNIAGITCNAYVTLTEKNGPETAKLVIAASEAEAYGIKTGPVAASASLAGEKLEAGAGTSLCGNPVKIMASGLYKAEEGLIKPALSGNIYANDLGSLQGAVVKFAKNVAVTEGSGTVEFSLSGEDMRDLSGKGLVKLSGLGLKFGEGRELKAVSTVMTPVYKDGRMVLPKTYVEFGGYMRASVSGDASKSDDGWNVNASLLVPETDAAKIQEGVLEALPPSLMWADIAGRAGCAMDVTRDPAGVLRVRGSLDMDGVTLDMPDKGVHIGPVDGSLPIGFKLGGKMGLAPSPYRGETFDEGHYPALVSAYSKVPADADIVIDQISYGFVELDAVALDLEPGDGYYDIKWFGLSTFDGWLYGYGNADLTGGSSHTLSLIVSDISLKSICDSAPGIKGYLTGRVDGLLRVVASSARLEDLAGAALFWAKDGPDEERAISKEFIKKLMGPSMKKYMLFGDRDFDTGDLDVVFLDGDLVFEKLLIANTNFFGKRDLYITVAPVSNRITIQHLLDVIRDVGSRTGNK